MHFIDVISHIWTSTFFTKVNNKTNAIYLILVRFHDPESVFIYANDSTTNRQYMLPFIFHYLNPVIEISTLFGKFTRNPTLKIAVGIKNVTLYNSTGGFQKVQLVILIVVSAAVLVPIIEIQ